MGYERLDSLTESQIEELCALYRNEWWSRERKPDDVRRMLRDTDIIIAFRVASGGPLVAFARVLTDFVYRAIVFDVIVAESHRGEGLSIELMEAIVHHPLLAKVEHIALWCLQELVPLYRRFGFTDEVGGLLLMVRHRAG